MRGVSIATATGLTAGLAARSSSLGFEELPEDVVELARQALIDWFGVTLGGSREDGPLMLLDTLPTRPVEDGGAVTVIGNTVGLSPRDAALLNGTASHALDFDDVSLRLPGHASVAIAAAALALAEQLGASGAELIVAFLAGYETACRVAAAVGPQPYLRGFHATGTIGTFGSTAACARLLELDAARTASAFGIAASKAAGLKCNLGTMTKSLHAGMACESGLLAAQLAARGFTADGSAIEAAQGFAALSGGGCDFDAALADPPDGWYLRGNLFKYHAACYFTHSTIEGLLQLRAAHDLTAASVRQITLHLSDVELGACVIPEPATGLEVKFSIAHLAAMALLGRDTTSIEDAAAEDGEAIAVRERVVVREDGAPGAPTLVEIELDDGRNVQAAYDVNTPERDLPAQRERLERKFRALGTPAIGGGPAEELLELLSRLQEVDVRPVMRSARSRGG